MTARCLKNNVLSIPSPRTQCAQCAEQYQAVRADHGEVSCVICFKTIPQALFSADDLCIGPLMGTTVCLLVCRVYSFTVNSDTVFTIMIAEDIDNDSWLSAGLTIAKNLDLNRGYGRLPL